MIIHVGLTLLYFRNTIDCYKEATLTRKTNWRFFLKNTTTEFRKKLSELKLIKSVQQALDMHAVESKIQSLEHKTNSLTMNQNARSQDFLALYNMTRVIENNVNRMGKQYTTQV